MLYWPRTFIVKLEHCSFQLGTFSREVGFEFSHLLNLEYFLMKMQCISYSLWNIFLLHLDHFSHECRTLFCSIEKGSNFTREMVFGIIQYGSGYCSKALAVRTQILEYVWELYSSYVWFMPPKILDRPQFFSIANCFVYYNRWQAKYNLALASYNACGSGWRYLRFLRTWSSRILFE